MPDINPTLRHDLIAMPDIKTYPEAEEEQCLEQEQLKQYKVSMRRSWSLLLGVLILLAIHGFRHFHHHHNLPLKILQHPFIDGHNDLLILLRYAYPDIYDSKFKDGFEKGGLRGEVDIPRILAGHYGGAFWSAFVPCPENGTDFSDANYAPYVKATLEQIDLFHRLGKLYPRLFTLSRTARDAEKAHSKNLLISPLIIEGLHQIGNSLATLRLYHELGVRYSTLTWNCHNKYADAALVSVDGKTVPSKPLHHGLSKAGRDLILEMNRLGMIVDLSHTSVDTMRDVLVGKQGVDTLNEWRGSLAPPIFSHSSVYAICPHPRNVPDDILDLVKSRKSVVMINFSPDFISCEEDGDLPRYVNETNTIDQVVKHITYVGERIGYDYVGIGTDFDGIESVPRGMEDVSKFPALVQKLLDHGVREKDIVNIIGGNILRVWKEVDAVAHSLRHLDPVKDF